MMISRVEREWREGEVKSMRWKRERYRGRGGKRVEEGMVRERDEAMLIERKRRWKERK